MRTHHSATDLLAQLGRAKAEVQRIENLINATTSKKLNDPNVLLDAVIRVLELQDDAELSHALGVHTLIFSKIRHREMGISVPLMKRIHMLTGLHAEELKALLAGAEKSISNEK